MKPEPNVTCCRHHPLTPLTTAGKCLRCEEEKPEQPDPSKVNHCSMEDEWAGEYRRRLRAGLPPPPDPAVKPISHQEVWLRAYLVAMNRPGTWPASEGADKCLEEFKRRFG